MDKYQTVRFDHNAYSVPRRWAFRAVTVKGYVDRVEVVADGQVVARTCAATAGANGSSTRCITWWCSGAKPAALDHAPVYRDWQLPPAFTDLRRDLEAGSARGSADRHFIRVLQLLADHPWPGSSRRSCSAAAAARRTPP